MLLKCSYRPVFKGLFFFLARRNPLLSSPCVNPLPTVASQGNPRKSLYRLIPGGPKRSCSAPLNRTIFPKVISGFRIHPGLPCGKKGRFEGGGHNLAGRKLKRFVEERDLKSRVVKFGSVAPPLCVNKAPAQQRAHAGGVKYAYQRGFI